MRRSMGFAAVCAVALTAVPSAQQANAIQSASTALRTANVRSLQITGSGTTFSVGQPPTASEAWPPVEVRSYTATLDLENNSGRVELLRFMGPVMPRGGGAPFTGEQRVVQAVSGNYAWNVAAAAGGTTPPAQPQPAAVAERAGWFVHTPQGFLKAAQANNATARNVSNGTEVTFTANGRRVVGIVNRQNQVERVQTWVDNPVLGDMLVESLFSGYRDFGGVQFPSQIRQTQGGHHALVLTVSTVQVNPTVDGAVPDNVRNAPPPPAPVAESEQLAEGVFHIRGGSHNSMAVDMGDHVVVVEGPLNEARSEVVIAETKKVIPNKPIRFVVNTHVHFDHSGGLRTFVDEGATVVTHQANRAFYEKAWGAPRTINPDRLAKSRKRANFQTVGERAVLRGTNNRTIELHLLKGNPHNEQTLVVWLPAEKILFQSDMGNPPAPNQQLPPPSPSLTNYDETLRRLNIQPEKIAGGHGNRAMTQADLSRLMGRAATPN